MLRTLHGHKKWQKTACFGQKANNLLAHGQNVEIGDTLSK